MTVSAKEDAPKKFGLRLTYRQLADALGLDDHEISVIVHDSKSARTRTVDLIFTGPKGVRAPEGWEVQYFGDYDLNIILDSRRA